MMCRSPLFTLGVLTTTSLLWACGGTVATPARDLGSMPLIIDGQSPTTGDYRQQRVDAMATAGKPCSLGGYCGAGLKCLAGVCRTMCPIPDNECNEKTDACQANEYCLVDGNFSGACVEGMAKLGESCGDSMSTMCPEGYLCVYVDPNNATCVALCKYGCPSGTTCRGSTNSTPSCKFCY